MIKAIGLHREASIAGKPEADMAICSLVGEKLRESGFSVEMIEPGNFNAGLQADLIFSMARTKETHRVLQKYVQKGVFV
ncbi:MAG: hypothetical protein Q8N60_02045, partial [Candidatus Diapherotrites archaeon]|nr:hypothetical protein [Candidatus Diapherotrites archaeon]